MNHYANSEFWNYYAKLPVAVRRRADKQFALLKKDPGHPSLRFKKLWVRNSVEMWSARVTLDYRALAFREPDGFVWFWIGHHSEYDSIIE